MSYTAKQLSYIDQFAADWLRRNGLTRLHLRNNFSLRGAYNESLASYIVANSQIFDPAHIDTARRVQATPIRELDTFSLGERASVFFGEAREQSQRLNPFSELNERAFWIIAVLTAVTASAVIAYRISPKNIAGK